VDFNHKILTTAERTKLEKLFYICYNATQSTEKFVSETNEIMDLQESLFLASTTPAMSRNFLRFAGADANDDEPFKQILYMCINVFLSKNPIKDLTPDHIDSFKQIYKQITDYIKTTNFPISKEIDGMIQILYYKINNMPIELGKIADLKTLVNILESDFFNTEIKTQLPDLEKISFGHLFNQKINITILPTTLKYLTFGHKFNQIIDSEVLPKSLVELTFGNDFNQKIKPGVLPQSLTHLTFGNNFNQEIEPNIFPPSLTHLTFGDDFDQKIKSNTLPQSLTHLKFGNKFNQDLFSDMLPEFLTHLTFGKNYDKSIKLSILPYSLTHLIGVNDFASDADAAADVDSEHKQINWPLNLTHLTFNNEFNSALEKGSLPTTLTHLVLGNKFNQEIHKDELPASLLSLNFGSGFSQKIKHGVLPNLLKHISFGNDMEEFKECDQLPTSLEHISVGLNAVENIAHIFPQKHKPKSIIDFDLL
jgi:hypothetical protein